MTADDELGMAWWNNLSEQERRRWAKAAGTGRAKDAWEAFKRGQDDPLRDAHTQLVGAIAELRQIGVPVPMALHRAAHALHYALRDREDADDVAGCRVLPFNREPRQ